MRAQLGAAGAEEIERRQLATTALRAVLTVAAMLLVYFLFPVESHRHTSIVARLTVALVLFAVTLAYEVRAIVRARHPMLRAAIAMALILPMFILVFAWTYVTMSASEPSAFAGKLSRVSALYFSITVFSTVGFGDITPKTDVARLVVSAQMLLDLVVIAVVVRLIIGAAKGALGLDSPVSGIVHRASNDQGSTEPDSPEPD